MNESQVVEALASAAREDTAGRWYTEARDATPLYGEMVSLRFAPQGCAPWEAECPLEFIARVRSGRRDCTTNVYGMKRTPSISVKTMERVIGAADHVDRSALGRRMAEAVGISMEQA